MAAAELTFCVVTTAKRELLGGCLDAIAREREALPFATETLVLDNCSRDGSAELARAHAAVDETIALDRRTGKGANDSSCWPAPTGRYGLLLNEDSELSPGATLALWQSLQEHPRAALAGARCSLPTAAPSPAPGGFRRPRAPSPSRWACRACWSCRAAAEETREVDWCQSSALLVRRVRRPREVGYLDPDFFVYSDEVDFARRLHDAGWRSLYVPGARGRPPRAALQRRPSAGGRESWNWPATATSTCASTTPPPRPARCAG